MVHKFLNGRVGSALIILIIAVTILQLSYLASFKLTSMIKKRSDEKELKFRLKAYKRAIEKFHKMFRRYPSKLEELITTPPTPKILRKLYKDPMSKNGKWKIIHLNDGILIKNVVSSSKEKGSNNIKYEDWSYNRKLVFTVLSRRKRSIK